VSLADELQRARWFGGKSRPIADTRVVDRARWVADASVCLVEVRYADGPAETYVLLERLDDPAVGRAALRRFSGGEVATEAGGALEFHPTHLYSTIPLERTEPIAPMRGEQSNTSIRFGDALILKLFRRLQFGPNPDVEVGWFLTEHSGFHGTPAVVGSLDYVSPGAERASLALLQQFEPNRGDAWTITLERLRRVLDGEDSTESLAAMARLGATTALLHLALASGSGDFAAESITWPDVTSWRSVIHMEVNTALEALRARGIQVEDATRLLHRVEGVATLRGSLKSRHHGDYHLGQVLERADGSFVIIDFEGEPAKPLAQRREKRSPLRDVAGMLRSFDYARHAALRGSDGGARGRLERATDWYRSVREAYLSSYVQTIRSAQPLTWPLVPPDVEPALAALELEKAAYEVLYELNNRPDWLPIPLSALT
jgi:maltose alpha-D-glucosyltransferase / alpha-amylase